MHLILAKVYVYLMHSLMKSFLNAILFDSDSIPLSSNSEVKIYLAPPEVKTTEGHSHIKSIFGKRQGIFVRSHVDYHL
jgi:hypothetical protein